jgi:hypothetical protein
MKPTSVNILGKDYAIEYCDKPSDVDIFKHESLWGQVDYWTRSIRIYENDRNDDDIFQNLLHEIIHAITQELHIATITDAKDNEEVVDLLALALADTLARNGWMK